MGKIRQLREDQLINGGSQEHIYPITHTKAVYSKDRENLQDIIDSIKEGDSLKDGSIKTRHLNDKSVTTNKLGDGSVTTPKISDGNVTTEKIANESITTPKIGSKAVTNEKIADSTLTLDKFDDNLKDAIEAATGLPSDVLEQFQNLSEDIADLQDSVYPITLSMNIAFDGTYHTVNFSVRNRGEAFVGDTLSLTKTLGSGEVITLTNIPTAGDTVQSPIEYNKEIFKLEVGANGHTAKNTSATRYICYAGGNASDTFTAEVQQTLNIYSSTDVSFNPTVTTTDGQYIWIIVPSYLTVNKVTSQGFNVTLQSAQSITTSLGSFKAYRTTNALTAQTWNLIIS